MIDVTRILNAIGQGDARATDKLLPLVYEEPIGRDVQKQDEEDSGQVKLEF